MPLTSRRSMSDEKSKPSAAESPIGERPTLASPTETQLEQEMPGGIAAHDSYVALRNNKFRLFMSSFFIAVIGGQITTVTALYQIDQRTHDAFYAGMAALALALPMLVLALPAGQIADTFARARIVMAVQGLVCLSTIGLAMVSRLAPDSPHLLKFIFALLALSAAATTIGRPARQALLPSLMPKAEFANAVTWFSSFFEIASMIGPAIGGFVLERSFSLAYFTAAGCSLCSIVLVGLLPRIPIEQRETKRGPMQEVLLGLRFVFSKRLMLSAMSLDLFAVLLGGAAFMLPAYAREVLHVGPKGFGFLRAAPSIGAFSMALLQAHRPPLRHAGRTMLLAVAGFGAATIGFGLSHSFILSLIMLIFTGALDNISVVVRHTLIQLLTPDYMRGRVSSVNQVFIGSSNELGGFESGVTARLFGLVPSVVIGGIGTIVVVIISALIFPEMRRLGALDAIKAEDIDTSSEQPATIANAS